MGTRFLIRWCIGVLTCGIIFLVYSGVVVDSLYAGLMIALIVGIVNAAMPHLLTTFSFSRNVLNLGLLLLIVNAVLMSIFTSVPLGIHLASAETVLLVSIMNATINWFAAMALESSLING